MENEKNEKKEKVGVDAETINTLVDAMGAIVRAIVATLPAPQQKVFLLRLLDVNESAEATGDAKLQMLIQTLVAAGQGEQRP